MPLKQFSGDIIVAETPRMVAAACSYLHGYPLLGFDTETKPSFRKGDVHPVALLQLAAGDKVVLIRLRKSGLVHELVSLLEKPTVLKPGVAIRDDLKGLQKITPFSPGGFIELQDIARDLGIKDFSLKKLCALLLGFRISKSQQLSNWEADSLTDQQILYAATDAWVSLLLYKRLMQIREAGHG